MKDRWQLQVGDANFRANSYGGFGVTPARDFLEPVKAGKCSRPTDAEIAEDDEKNGAERFDGQG